MRAVAMATVVSLLAGLAAAPLASAQGVAANDNPRVIQCGSKDGRWNHCNVDPSGRVELIRQVSRAPCLRNQSWGVDKTGIWVNSGCRADFNVSVVSGAGDRSPRIVRCESEHGLIKERCQVRTRGGVRVARQLSRTACVEGETWGITRNTIWVAGGCAADFEVTPSGKRDWRWWRNDD